MTLTFGRWAVALGPILFAARKTLRADLATLRGHWLYVSAMGALGFTAFNALFYAAASLTGAINLSIIQGAIPAFVLLAARFGFGDTVTALQALGAFAALAGVTAIAAQGDWSRLAGLAFNVGDLMVLIACLLYAGYTLGLRERPRVSPLGLLAGMALAAFVARRRCSPAKSRRAASSGRPARACCCCSTPRSAPPSPGSSSICAASS